MDALQRIFAPIIGARLFTWVFNSLVMINPIALLPQTYTAWTAPSVEGISLVMYCIFFLLQGTAALFGIKVRSWGMLISMSLSMIESACIIAAVTLRS